MHYHVGPGQSRVLLLARFIGSKEPCAAVSSASPTSLESAAEKPRPSRALKHAPFRPGAKPRPAQSRLRAKPRPAPDFCPRPATVRPRAPLPPSPTWSGGGSVHRAVSGAG